MSHPKQVRLAGSVLDRSRHVCAFFHDKEEEYRVLLPFIKEGFDQGDRAFHMVDRRHPPGKPVLRAARRIPARVAGTERAKQPPHPTLSPCGEEIVGEPSPPGERVG
jgi:hypothetical protein